MPRLRITEKTVFTFEELSDSAKERARDWFREGNLDYDWWEFVYDDAKTCGEILGIDFASKPHGRGHRPAIWFSGFSSQGDGACFEGRYAYAKGAARAIREHAPQDTRLHQIVDDLQAIQRRNFYRLEARMSHRGHYYHSGCMSVETTSSHSDTDADLTDPMRSFADWIYRQLETEYEYQNSDDVVDESIIANEYEFDEEGSRA